MSISSRDRAGTFIKDELPEGNRYLSLTLRSGALTAWLSTSAIAPDPAARYAPGPRRRAARRVSLRPRPHPEMANGAAAANPRSTSANAGLISASKVMPVRRAGGFVSASPAIAWSYSPRRNRRPPLRRPRLAYGPLVLAYPLAPDAGNRRAAAMPIKGV